MSTEEDLKALDEAQARLDALEEQLDGADPEELERLAGELEAAAQAVGDANFASVPSEDDSPAGEDLPEEEELPAPETGETITPPEGGEESPVFEPGATKLAMIAEDIAKLTADVAELKKTHGDDVASIARQFAEAQAAMALASQAGAEAAKVAEAVARECARKIELLEERITRNEQAESEPPSLNERVARDARVMGYRDLAAAYTDKALKAYAESIGIAGRVWWSARKYAKVIIETLAEAQPPELPA